MFEVKEMAIIGGGLFILVLLLFALKVQNQKIRDFLRGPQGAARRGEGERAVRRNLSGQSVAVDQLQEGDVVGEDVGDPAGKVILLEKGTRLTEKNIDKLKKWGVRTIWLQ